MEIGIVGLGRMGGNMVRRLARAGVRVVGYTRNEETRAAFAAEGVLTPAPSIVALAKALAPPRVVWLMVPAGSPTELAIEEVWPELTPGDTIVDGGNANYKDSQRRGAALASANINFVDCGVSGGIWGLENGYAMMFGGDEKGARAVEPFIKILAPGPDHGWLHCGPHGSGHFVKMIHNGIEYGMMESLAEGFALLDGKKEFGLDVAAIAEMWRYGSVVRSWLLDLTAAFLRENPKCEGIAPFVADSGEGRWTIDEAVEQGMPAPALAIALMARFASQGKSDYPNKLLAMMRKGFGGHAIRKDGA